MSLIHVFLIVLIVAAVVAVVFLVRLFIQLRTTAAEAEKTLAEVRVLVQRLSELDLEVKARVGELGETLRVSRKAAVGLSEATMQVASKLLPGPARFLPFVLPAAGFLVRLLQKKKEKRHVE
jgi:cytochrome c-type biogenesis protein CcmH/NrfG